MIFTINPAPLVTLGLLTLGWLAISCLIAWYLNYGPGKIK